MWESVREIVNNENDFLYNFIDERLKNWNGFIEDVEEIVVGIGNDKLLNKNEWLWKQYQRNIHSSH